MNSQTSIGELLIRCLGMGDPPPTASELEHELEQLTSSDWDGIIRGAILYNVAPLLYHRLKELSLDAVIPANAAQKLRQCYLNSALKNMRLYRDLSEVIKVFQSNDIPVIVLKGAHLAKVVYGNIAIRQMCDLDLLVQESDLPKVVKAMLEMGYSPVRPYTMEGEYTKKRLPSFIKKNAIPIEIHWHIKHRSVPFSIDTNGLWKRAQPASINDLQVMVLSPEDLILHLCVHATHHIMKAGLRPFCDLFEVIRHYRDEIDWKQVQHRSLEWKAERPLYIMLSVLKELSGKALPEDLLSILKSNPIDEHLVAEFKEYIIKYTVRGINSSSKLILTLTQFWESKGLMGKASFFLESAFPSRQYIAKVYHIHSDSKRVYFYYPVRLKDIVLRYSYIMWRLCRYDKETMALAKLGSRQTALKNWLISR